MHFNPVGIDGFRVREVKRTQALRSRAPPIHLTTGLCSYTLHDECDQFSGPEDDE